MSNQINNIIILSLLSGAVAGVITTAVLLNNANFVNNRLAAITAQTNGSAPRNIDASATAHEDAIINTVERSNPAVVSIVVSRDVQIIERYFEEVPGSGDPFFDRFFGPFSWQVPQYREGETERREVGGGSGFIITDNGMIVTNRHVVSREDAEYTVFTNDGNNYEAEVVARDPFNDIAILQIEASDLPFLEFADSNELRVGQTVIAIGNALAEFRNTVSTGVISGLSRSVVAGDRRGQSEQLEEVIQTDAAINPGNSGGPLIDLSGRVVGVNVAVALGSQNIGFALPSNTVKEVVESVKETGTIVRPFLGIRYVAITPGLQTRHNLPVDYGVLIVRGETPDDQAVVPDSPADQAGLRENDILLEVNGTRLDENESLASIIRRKNVGDVLRLKILRGDEEIEVNASLEPMPL